MKEKAKKVPFSIHFSVDDWEKLEWLSEVMKLSVPNALRTMIREREEAERDFGQPHRGRTSFTEPQFVSHEQLSAAIEAKRDDGPPEGSEPGPPKPAPPWARR